MERIFILREERRRRHLQQSPVSEMLKFRPRNSRSRLASDTGSDETDVLNLTLTQPTCEIYCLSSLVMGATAVYGGPV